MGWPVNVVESGGLPVSEAPEGYGTPIDQAADGYGYPITIVESGGFPVFFGSGTWSATGATDEDEEMAAFIERLAREGDFRTLSTFATATPPSGSGNTQIAALAAPQRMGKIFYARKLQAAFNAQAIGQVQITADASGRFNSPLWQFVDRLEPVDVDMFIRAFQVTNGIAALAVRYMATGAAIYGGLSLTGYEVTDDLDFGAPKVIMLAGDSTICGTGPSLTATHWPFMFKKYLSDTYGVRARLVAKSRSGSTTADHELWRAAGWHDIEQCDLCIYNVSINDVINAVANNTTVANMMAFWDWFKQRYPQGKMIICGTTPLENNTPEALAVTLRTAIPAAIALRPAEEQARLKFIDLGSAFDRTNATFYAGTDTPGSRMHPDDDGNAAISPVFNAAYTALVDAGFSF